MSFKHVNVDHDLKFFCSWLGQLPVSLAGHPLSITSISWEPGYQVDWQRLINHAQNEGLAPLMYWVLSKSDRFSTLPDAVRNSLRLSYARTWMNNYQIFKELTTLSKRFRPADIQAVVLKGACFALTIYPDIGLRPMGDLDILVPASKLTAAVEIAGSLGFKKMVPEAAPGLTKLLNAEICLQKTSAPSIILEIHHRLGAGSSFNYSVPVEWFWEQTETLDSARSNSGLENLLMLTPTAQVLFTVAHAMLQHGGYLSPLRWFYDLDRLIRVYSQRLDWDLLLFQAQRFGWSSALAAAMRIAVDRFQTPVPDPFMTSLEGISDRHQSLVAQKQAQPPTHVLDELQNLRSLSGYARIRTFLAIVIPSPAYMRWRYHLKTSWRLPAYYLLRWGRILKDGLHTFRLLIRKSAGVS
jgi:hypothetical protein